MFGRITPVVKYLLVINLAIFGIGFLIPFNFSYFFGLHYIFAESFQPWQLLTYMFLHGGLMHIFSNMFGLFIFGPLLEQVLGSKRFLMFYLICGVGAGVLNFGITYWELNNQEKALNTYVAEPTPDGFVYYMSKYEPQVYRRINMDFLDAYEENPTDKRYQKESIEAAQTTFEQRINIPTVGASGAIFGLLVAFALIFPNLEMMMLFFPVPIKAKYLVSLYVLYELYASFGYAGASNIAHFAHVSGAIVGFLLIRYWRIPRRY